jgi:flagellar protein FliO/FliZ
MESFAMNFTGMLLALTAVIAVAWLALRLLRDRMQPGMKPGQAAGEAVRFVRALPVGAKERVVIVEHRGERWMLGVTAGGISTIAHWPSAGGDLGARSLAGTNHQRGQVHPL